MANARTDAANVAALGSALTGNANINAKIAEDQPSAHMASVSKHAETVAEVRSVSMANSSNGAENAAVQQSHNQRKSSLMPATLL